VRCISFKARGKDDEHVLNALTVLGSLVICVASMGDVSVKSETGVLGTGESEKGRSRYVDEAGTEGNR
jgi:hypothetical protein